MGKLIDKEKLIEKLLKLPGVGSNSNAMDIIYRFESPEIEKSSVEVNDLDYYKLEMVLVDSEKKKQLESYKNLSLNDFEVIYGNETREIEAMILIKQKGFEE